MENVNDNEIIFELKEKGLIFLDNLLYQNSSNKTIIFKLIQYEKLFLNEDELFENGKKEYLDFILQNDTNIWSIFCNFLNEKEIYNYLNGFSLLMKDISLENKILCLGKLLKPNKLHGLFKFPKQENLWDCFFKSIIDNLYSKNEVLWENNIKQTQIIIKNFINKNKYIRKYFINWVSHILNSCIKKINLDIMNYDTNLPSDYFLISLLGILISFWKEGFTDSKINFVNYDYIISEKCPINWIEKKKFNKKEYNFLTKCFFLILNNIRIGYIPSIYRGLKWNKELDIINKEINNILNNNLNTFSQLFLNNLYEQKKIINNQIKIGKNISNNTILKKWINSFYEKVIIWLEINKEKMIDDILNDMIFFLIHMNDNEEKYTNVIISNENIFNLILDIIGSRIYTSNVGIKCDALKLFKKVLFPKLSFLNNSKEIINKFTKSIMILFLELNDTNIRPDFKFFKKIEIFELIMSLYFNSNNEFKNILLEVLILNQDLTKKFLNIILLDLCELNDIIDKLYVNLKEFENNIIETEDIKKTINQIIIIYGKILKFLNQLASLIVSIESLKNILFSKEIFIVFTSILNLSIQKITKKILFKNNLGFDILNNSDNKFNVEDFIENVKNIIITIYVNNADLTILIDDYAFDISSYEELNEYLNEELNPLIDDLKITSLKNNEINMDLNDIPQEFLDPITYLPIENPCLLPGMVGFSNGNIYFDKSTIIRHLLIKEENPYTRSQLTIKEFEDFNNSPEIKSKNMLFQNNFEQFNNKLKKK